MSSAAGQRRGTAAGPAAAAVPAAKQQLAACKVPCTSVFLISPSLLLLLPLDRSSQTHASASPGELRPAATGREPVAPRP